MIDDEFIYKETELLDKIESAKVVFNMAKTNLENYYMRYTDELNSKQEYIDMMDKLVSVEYKDKWSKQKSVEGIFGGFAYIKDVWHLGIYIKLHTMKKDGTKSKRLVDTYDMPLYANTKSIQLIEK